MRVEDALVMVAVIPEVAVEMCISRVDAARGGRVGGGGRGEPGMVNTGTVHHPRIELLSLRPQRSLRSPREAKFNRPFPFKKCISMPTRGFDAERCEFRSPFPASRARVTKSPALDGIYRYRLKLNFLPPRVEKCGGNTRRGGIHTRDGKVLWLRINIISKIVGNYAVR